MFKSHAHRLQIPAVIVGISVAIRWEDYGTSRHCWLSTSNGTIWAFIAPLLLILAFNTFVFIRVMIAVLTMKRKITARKSSLQETDRYKELVKGIRASLSFLCLLGVTWIFGALAIGGSSAVVFFYIFALLNVLQGVIIFIFHCLLDPKFAMFPSVFIL